MDTDTATDDHNPRMFRVTIANVVTFKRAFDMLKTLLDEIRIEINDHGMTCQAIDDAHVGAIDMRIPAVFFQSYQCNRSVMFCTDLHAFRHILGCADDGDICTIEVSYINPESLKFTFENQGQFSLKLLDEIDTLSIPIINYTATISATPFDMYRRIKSLYGLADSVKFEIDKNGASLSINGEIAIGGLFLKRSIRGAKINDAKEKERTWELEISAPDRVSQWVSLEYLLKILKIYTQGSGVKIRLSDDAPLRVEAEFFGISIHYYLAPLIEKYDPPITSQASPVIL